jgi:hypothetical protein
VAAVRGETESSNGASPEAARGHLQKISPAKLIPMQTNIMETSSQTQVINVNAWNCIGNKGGSVTPLANTRHLAPRRPRPHAN